MVMTGSRSSPASVVTGSVLNSSVSGTFGEISNAVLSTVSDPVNAAPSCEARRVYPLAGVVMFRLSASSHVATPLTVSLDAVPLSVAPPGFDCRASEMVRLSLMQGLPHWSRIVTTGSRSSPASVSARGDVVNSSS